MKRNVKSRSGNKRLGRPAGLGGAGETVDVDRENVGEKRRRDRGLLQLCAFGQDASSDGWRNVARAPTQSHY